MPGIRQIDKSVPIPYYYQITQILREEIRDAGTPEGQEGAAFPSEPELCRRFGVSRGVVRQALQLLEREGLIRRERGRGTFVTRRRLEHELTHLCSVTADLKARGWVPGARLLGVRAMDPSPSIRHSLRLAQGEQVWEVHRLRLADGEAVSLQWCYIPVRLTPGLDQQDLTGSLWSLFSSRYGLALAVGDQTVRTRCATPGEAHLLQIAEGDAVFVITRTIYDRTGVPLQYLDSLWRGDRYDFKVRLYSRPDFDCLSGQSYDMPEPPPRAPGPAGPGAGQPSTWPEGPGAGMTPETEDAQ